MLSLDGMGMTELTYLAEYDSWPELPVALEHPEVRAATRGFANPNPLTQGLGADPGQQHVHRGAGHVRGHDL